MKIYKYNSIRAVNQRLAELEQAKSEVIKVELLTTPTGTILYFIITNEVEKLEEKPVVVKVKTIIKEPKPGA